MMMASWEGNLHIQGILKKQKVVGVDGTSILLFFFGGGRGGGYYSISINLLIPIVQIEVLQYCAKGFMNLL